MKLNLLAKVIDTLPPGTHYDLKCPGLVLNVTPTSRRFGIYVWNPRTQKPVRAAIGPWPAFSIEQARDKARELIYAIKRGEGGEDKPKAKATLGDLADNYELALKATGAKRPDHNSKVIDAGCLDWRNRPADSITRQEVEQRHNEISASRGAAAAGRFVKTFRTIYRHADMDSPAARVRIAAQRPRARVANRDELAAIRVELEKQDPYWRDYFLLSILTGARRGNVSSMRFEDVAGSTWTIPATKSKTNEAITLPLVPEVVEIIEARRKVQGSGFVFPAKGSKGHVTHTWDKWNEIRTAAGAPDVTQHDLRRTLISRLAEAGVNPAIAAKAAGHRSVITTLKIYTTVRQDQVLEALNRLS